VFIKYFVLLLNLSFFSCFVDPFCTSAAATNNVDDRMSPARMSVYLYPRTVADVRKLDFSVLKPTQTAPVELIYWAVGFKRERDGTVKAHPKSHNPGQTGDQTHEIIKEIFKNFPEENGYLHTWLVDTCLQKHAGLVDEVTERLLPSFNEGQRGPLVRDIIITLGELVEKTGHRLRAISVDIEPICKPDGSDSLLGFHADLVSAINGSLRVPVSVHMSCSKIHEWLTIDPSSIIAGSPAERALGEFGRLVDAVRTHRQSYLIVDAYCHGNSCEHQPADACSEIDGREERSCQWQHFTNCKKLQAIFTSFTGMRIPFKTVLAISGSSSGGITPTGWNIGNFRRSLERIRSEGPGIDLKSPYLRGFALYGVDNIDEEKTSLQDVVTTLNETGFRTYPLREGYTFHDKMVHHIGGGTLIVVLLSMLAYRCLSPYYG